MRDSGVKVMFTPKTVDISITDKCNLRCKYCYHFESSSDVQDLPTAEWVKFFRECGECAVLDVCLAGGEPFIRPDLKELVDAIVENRMRFSILTNGTLITKDMAKFLARTGRCDYVQVSIDGSKAAAHDACRGRGAWDKALRGVRILQECGVNVAVRVTIHKYNIEDLPDIAKMLLEDLGLSSFGTNSAGYMGLCKSNAGFVQLDARERTRAMEILLALNRRYEGRINAQAGPLAEAQHWQRILAAQRAGEKSLPHCGYLTGCGCPWSKIAVLSDGTYVPCGMLSHIKLGRINRDSLRAIWQTHPELDRIRHRHEIPLSSFKFCEDCEFINYCTGNCPALAWTMVGDVYHPSPDACLREFLKQGGRIPELVDDTPGCTCS